MRALISVSDKTGVVEFARALAARGVEIISTGGTMQALRQAGLPVTYVSDVTGFPECLDGRVKTLHPRIHGGILAVRDNPEHVAQMAQNGIAPIDIVAVNLYPFRETVARLDVTLAEAIENIDIGGPALIRAAAKNFRFVTVVTDPAEYDAVLQEMAAPEGVSYATRLRLARRAFAHTAAYDACIAAYLAGQLGEGKFPQELQLVYDKIADLRYGENPHQQAAFYRERYGGAGPGVATARQLHGKELSYNNIVDLEAAYRLAAEFTDPAAVIIKHTNPCGTAVGATLAEAYEKALAADPVSAFGGIIGLNREVDEATAQAVAKLFAEAVIAPDFAPAALAVLTRKKNIRLLATGAPFDAAGSGLDCKRVSGGLLVQDADVFDAQREEMKVVTKRQPTPEEWRELAFAWKVVKHVKSNAIVVTAGGQTLGVGAGQMNRVGAAEIALQQAGEKARGAVLASDAFFPFRDTVDAAAQAGIAAVIQPGGSIRDEESIAAADAAGMAMVFTGVRHFKH